MTGPKRRLSETEEEEDAIAAGEEARGCGLRAYRHWRDRGEPPASTSAVAMRQACPYVRGDPRVEPFFLGWMLADGTAWDREWCALKHPELRGRRCRVVRRDGRTKVEIEFPDGRLMTVPQMWVRRIQDR